MADSDSTEPSFHALWLGSLGPMELLTLHSFAAFGHPINLWLYGSDCKNIPYCATIRDAAQILPPERVFRYDGGENKGCVQGFSDLFRYKLLYQEGGWWIDMDVVCLKQFTGGALDQPYVLRPHHKLPLVGNLMKVPVNSELMLACYKDCAQEIDASNRNWHKPITYIAKHAKRLSLMKYKIRDRVFGNDAGKFCRPYYTRAGPVPPRSQRAIHWCKSYLEKNGIKPHPQSFYRQQLGKYGIKWANGY